MREEIGLTVTHRRFVCFFKYTDWAHFSLGAHIDFRSPNAEIHVPFGLFRIGLSGLTHYSAETVGKVDFKKTSKWNWGSNGVFGID